MKTQSFGMTWMGHPGFLIGVLAALLAGPAPAAPPQILISAQLKTTPQGLVIEIRVPAAGGIELRTTTSLTPATQWQVLSDSLRATNIVAGSNTTEYVYTLPLTGTTAFLQAVLPGLASIAGGPLTATVGLPGTTIYTVSVAPSTDSVVLTLTGGFATFAGGALTVTLADGGTFTLDGVTAGTGTLTAKIAGTVVLTAPVVVTTPASQKDFVTTSPLEPANNPAVGAGSAYLANGQVHLERTDLAVPGRGETSFAFKRAYKSNVQYDGPLGIGWVHGYDLRLRRIDASTLEWLNGNARAERFTLQGNGTYAPPAGFFVKLMGDDTGWTIREPDGTRYVFRSLAEPLARGMLAQISDRHGNRLAFTYGTSGNGAGRLVQVLDPYDRACTLGYDAAGRITSLQDFSGRTVTYHYSSNGDLIKVIGPAITATTTGGPLLAENQFPNGRCEIYAYTSGQSDPRLNHKLTLVVAPNEAAGVPDASLEAAAFLSPLARVQNTWTTDPLSPNFGKLATQRWGGANANGTAGGTYTLTYAALTPAGVDPINDEVQQVSILDRAGNLSDFFLNAAGQCVRVRQHANRLVRPRGTGLGQDPAFFETRHTYNADGLRTSTTRPLGNRTLSAYDSSSPNRCSQGNLLARTLVPDARGDSRGGTQPRVVTFKYEPIFNQVCATTDARGNDPSYPPQNGGPWSAARYTTTRKFDYQQSATAASLAAEAGLDVATTSALLSAAGVTLGLGDLNEDASDNAFASGDVVCVYAPPVTLTSGQTRQRAVWTSGTQVNLTLKVHNRYGQLTKMVDPERNVTIFTYNSSFDPDGDGSPVPGTTQSDTTGGYLQTTVVDASADPHRESNQNPPPANLTTRNFYDTVGNVIRRLDGRGIEHQTDYNAVNEVVRKLAATDTSRAYLSRDRALPALNYEKIILHDANGNVIETRVGNQGERDGSGTPVATNPYWSTKHRFDILDDRITTIQEITPVADDASITESTPGVAVTRSTYDPNQNPILVTQPEGNAVATTSDERDQVFTVTRGFGTALAATTKTFYDWNGNPACFVDAVKNNPGKNPSMTDGDMTKFGQDGFDEPISVTDAELNESKRVYDPSGQRVRAVRYGPPEEGAPRLAETARLNDELGRCFMTIAFAFDYNSNTTTAPFLLTIPTIASNPNPGEQFAATLTDFDALGRTVRNLDMKGDESLSDFDGVGRPLRIQGPIFFDSTQQNSARNEKGYGYDGANNMMIRTDIDRSPSLNVTQNVQIFVTDLVFDAAGRLIRKSDSKNFTTRSFYDSRGNVIATTDAKSAVTVPDPISLRGGPVSINNHGNVTRVFYDGLSRQTKVERLLKIGGQGDGDPNLTTDTSLDTSNSAVPTGIITTLTFYDRNGRVIGRQDANDNPTAYGFDALDRPTTATFADLSTQSTVFDADDHVIQTTDPNQTVIHRTYDGVDRLVKINVTRQGANLNGTGQNVIGTTLQAFEWDGLGRLRAQIDDNGAAATLGVATDCTYDSLSRKMVERHRINASVNAADVTTTTGRVSVISIGATIDKSVTSGYAAPQPNLVMPVRTSIGYPEFGPPGGPPTLTFNLDGENRQTSIFLLGNPQPLANYDWLGARPALRRTPTVTTTFTYDPQSPSVSDIVHICASGENHAEFRYMEDANYNWTSEQRLDFTILGQPTTAYAVYDSLNRGTVANYGILGTNPPASTTSYQLDGAENFMQRTENGITTKYNANPAGLYVPNVLNEYTKIQTFNTTGTLTWTQSPVYDAAGAQIQGEQRHVFYDAFERVVKVDRSSDAGVTFNNVGNYTYTADGRRVTKRATIYDSSGAFVRSEQTAYIHDGPQEVEEIDQPSGAIRLLLIHGATEVDEHLAVLQFTTGRAFFCHADAQQSVVVVTDFGTGNPIERYEYTSIYGKFTVRDPGPTGGQGTPRPLASEIGNPWRFQGRRFDDESGLYYFRNRYLDPDQGRFVSRDPNGIWGDPGNAGNPYAFEAGNPQNRRDPFGLLTSEEVGPQNPNCQGWNQRLPMAPAAPNWPACGHSQE